MIGGPRHSRRATWVPTAILLFAPLAALATPLPDPNRLVHETVQDAAIGPFLQQLAAPAGAPVSVSPKITGSVSGVFEGKLEAVLAKVGGAFGAAYYYDGQKMVFYPAADRMTRTFDLGPYEARRVRLEALRQKLPDAQDTLELQGGRLTAVGAPAFVDRIGALASSAPASLPPRPRSTEQAAERRGQEQPAVEYRVFYLRYGWAADTRINSGDRLITIPGVASILRALMSDTAGGEASTAAMTVVSTPAAQPGLAGTGLAAAGGQGDANEPAAAPPNTLARLFGLTAAAPKPAAAARAVEPAAPANAPASPFRVESDPRLNALIVRDTPAHLDLYASLITALDVEPTLVEIEASIIDVDIERAKQSGFNLSFSQPNGSGFTSSLDGVIPSFPQPGGISVSAVIGDRNLFVAKLEALESEGVARIVSSPLVMTLSDVEASFQNDQTFYVPVNGSLSTDLYNVTAGTNLRVTPHVTHDKMQDRIRLIVEIDDGSLSSQLVGAIPVVHKASLNTQALILSGQSLLVGGMVSQNNTDYRAKVPGVSDVPLIGQLFRASRKVSGHTERLFLITPRLATIGAQATAPAGTQELPRQAEVQR